jgi:hypothetical protein
MTRLTLMLAICVVLCGCKKKTTQPTTAPTVIQTTAVTVPSENTNYEAGAGAAQNIRNAAKRLVTMAEMSQLGVFIELEYTNNGKMPGVKTLMASLQKDSPNTYKMIQEGTIILCWTASHEGLWAYEVDADKKGGIGLITGQARRCEASEIQSLLPKR